MHGSVPHLAGGVAPPLPIGKNEKAHASMARRVAIAHAAGGVALPANADPAPVKRRPASAAQVIRNDVMRGVKDKTKGGLRPYSRHTGKVIAKHRSDRSQERYEGPGIDRWNACLKEAIFLGFQGRFVPVGGKTRDGQLFLECPHAVKRMRGW